MAGADDIQTPQRMTLANLRSGDVLTAQYNPSDLKRVVKVAYARLGILGQSHQQLQYQWRDNESFDFELHFDKLSTDKGDSTTAENLLDACTLPTRAAQTVGGGGPPDVLFMWPAVLTLRCRISELEYSYKRFALNGLQTYFTCKVKIEEARDTKLFAEDVLANGLMRR